MTRRYGPGCAAELSPRRPLHRVVHEIANHPPHISFYQFSQPHIHNNAPPTSSHKTPENKKKKTQMALPKYPTEQFLSSPFLICGGSILFASTHEPLQVCLLHHNIRDEWLLPKGRKDRGEDVTATAVRETFEETGYRVSVPAAASRPDHAYARGGRADEVSDSACSWEWESLILTFRRTDVGVKLIWWFATVNTREDTVVDGHDLPRLFAQESCLPHLDPQGSCRSSHLRRRGRPML